MRIFFMGSSSAMTALKFMMIPLSLEDMISAARPASFHDQIPLMLILMNIGGNKRARDLFHEHGGWTDGGDVEANYNSLAAKLYRSTLLKEAITITRGMPRHSISELLDINVTEVSKECTLEDQNPEETDEARRRFPNAKSISCSRFFRDQVETNVTEAKHRLQKVANATAISSADLFECSARTLAFVSTNFVVNIKNSYKNVQSYLKRLLKDIRKLLPFPIFLEVFDRDLHNEFLVNCGRESWASKF